MKQTLRLRGELCPENKLNIKILYTIFITFTIVLVSCVCTRAQVSASSQEAGPAAEAVSEIKPLKIGDTIPDALWNMPLQMVKAGQEGTSTVTLNDYKGKLIILDFWSTWCGSCIQALPKMQLLQKEFAGQLQILPVTMQKNSIVSAFLSKNKIGTTLQLPIITADTILNNTFKYKLISHLVWINPKGVVCATTWSDYVNKHNIQQVLREEKLHWSMKNDLLSFDQNESLLTFSDIGVPMPSFKYHSTFLGHLRGVRSFSGIHRDSSANTVRRFDLNASLIALCVRAWGKRLHLLSPKQYIYEVKDLGRYLPPDGAYKEDWDRENTYCYEAVLPIETTDEEITRILKEDLKRYLKVEGTAEKRSMEVLVISRLDSTAANKQAAEGVTLKNYIWHLNQKVPDLPFAINETGLDKIVVPAKIKALTELTSINELLRGYGLMASRLERKVDVFIIREL